ANTVAGWLKDPLGPDTIKEMFTAGAMPAATPAIFPNAKLGGQEQYEALKAKVAAGDLPELSQMSEQQRQQVLSDYPGLLDYLMGQKRPSQQVMEDVYHLAVPHVDGQDGNRNAATVL